MLLHKKFHFLKSKLQNYCDEFINQFPLGSQKILAILLALVAGSLLILRIQSVHKSLNVVYAANQETTNLYLPIILSPDPIPGANLPLMLGTYVDGWLAEQDDIDIQYHALDDWVDDVGGAHLSIAGTFVDIDTPNYTNYVTDQLLTAWDNGFTPFVNIGTKLAAYQVARGDLDDELRSWARAYAAFSQNGERIAFIAPLPEMNGRWVPYGLNTVNYKLAYQHIQQIFEHEGVSQNDVIWTFAPNGWHKTGDPPFEEYYPGDEFVDVVGFSGYNFGGCSSGIWENPEEVYGSYIDRMAQMAPNKPIFITQTASTSTDGNKEKWLLSAYAFLESQTKNNLRGIIYFNIDNKHDSDCDWAFYKTWGGNQRIYNAYRIAVSNPTFGYVEPTTILETFK